MSLQIFKDNQWIPASESEAAAATAVAAAAAAQASAAAAATNALYASTNYL